MPPSRLPALLLPLAALVIAGCMHVPLSTIARLWSFDVATADPTVIRVAVRVPDHIAPREGGVRLDVSVALPAPRGTIRKSYVLVEVTEAEERARIAHFGRPGYRLAAYRLSAVDAAHVRTLQMDAKLSHDRTGSRARGNLGVAADACRLGPLTDAPLLSSTFLLVEPKQGYLVLLDDVDLRSELGHAPLLSNIPPCKPSAR